MKYDFDKVIPRRNTNSLKWDFAEKRGRSADILPLWVADMDFAAPDEVVAALKAKAEHGIFGYSEPLDDYYAALNGWFGRRHGWKTQADKFVLSCGVVFAINTLIRVLTKQNDAVIVLQPVYYPFSQSVVANGRKLVVSELVTDGARYTVNFEDFEQKIRENDVKLFILCSPHNPVGRVWTREELKRMGDICLRCGVFVISDEIHADFVYGENKHTVFSTVDQRFENVCAILTAPTKTFNLAGLHNANIYIPDDGVRAAFVEEQDRQGYSQSNVMGIVACQAAYTYGEEWLEQLKAYLTENIAFVRQYLGANMPKVKLYEPEGTYLLWLDFSAYGLTDGQLKDVIEKKAGVWLDGGYVFGRGGSGFQRINAACPRSTLKEALERIYAAFNGLN
ncbi:MAG: MalY/PatB family protein [Candidatus Coproplasma sp.]